MDRILSQFDLSEGMIRDLLVDAEIIAGSGARSPQIEQAVKTLALALASKIAKITTQLSGDLHFRTDS